VRDFWRESIVPGSGVPLAGRAGHRGHARKELKGTARFDTSYQLPDRDRASRSGPPERLLGQRRGGRTGVS